MKLINLINQYINYRRSLGEKFLTEAGYLKAFCRIAGKSTDPNNISTKKIKDFLYGDKKSVTSYWFHKHSTLVGFYHYSIGRGYINKYPLPKILPKRPSLFVPYIYTREELRTIFKTALIYQKRKNITQPYMVQVILILLYCTGLRIREALSLTIADVDLYQSILTIRGTKFYKTRFVPYEVQLSKIISAYIFWRRNHGYLENKNSPFFINENGNFISVHAMENIFRRIREKTGIKRTDKSRYQPRLHDIRHTFAVHRLTSWYQEHADVQKLLPILSVYMGHANPSLTSVYLTMTTELLREAGNRFEQYAIGGVK